jgi:16S rRNA G966 N2-methylase RsmD
VAKELGADNLSLVRGDALRYISAAPKAFDIVFADPPYDMDGFAEIPGAILSSRLVREGTLVIVEHNKSHDFSALPGFMEHRAYGSVNFSIFKV